MTRPPSTRDFQAACLALLLAFVHVSSAHSQGTAASGAAPIAESEIVALQDEFAKNKTATSDASKRRSFKSTVRKAEGLLDASPAAPNRFRVLGVVLQCRKYLLVLENSERNRNALFETCSKLAEAPDEYADIRLEADLLLSNREMALKDADVKERARVLEELIARYRGTSGESKCLILAAQIAPKLGASDLQETIANTMRDRLSGDHDVIQWHRKHSGFSSLEAMFTGTYARADGVALRFPIDRAGRPGVMVFWSQETPGFEAYLKQIQELHAQYPNRFDVFSFNLDELPDGGKAVLRKLELDWTVMQLPGGKESKAFRTYAQKDPVGVFFNAYGRGLLTHPEKLEEKFSLSIQRLSDERYLAQLQSLFIGDFLVGEKHEGPTSKLESVQACFVPPPFRYRLARDEALANYGKAATLCADAIKETPESPDVGLLRNHRIIALLGMWNLAGEPEYLEQAAREANASLAATPPAGADVVPRFCLAKAALRRGENGESVVAAFVAATGGTEAPASAVAAAAILSLDANSRDLHERYRAKLLAFPDGDNPTLWPVVAFLRDRVHTYDLLRANYIWRHGLRERERIRNHVINHGAEPTTDRLPEITLKTLDGRTLSLPQDTNGKLTMLVFVEPSAEPNAEFPIDVGVKDKDVKLGGTSMLTYGCYLADRHVNKDVTTIAAFLSEDTERIKALIKARGVTCQAAVVPGGIANPMVRRLGVLSADRHANLFLIRRDGSVAWQASGLSYPDNVIWVNMIGTKVQIEVCEVNHAYRAFEKGDFKEAARVFDGPYLPWSPDYYGWRSPRRHGQALAYMALKDWKAALESIDTAIEAKKLKYFQGRRNKDPAFWRKEAATVTVNRPDDVLVELWATKAVILDKLGRKEEAAQMRRRSEEPAEVESPTVYKLFHEKLKNWREANEKEASKP